MTVWFCMARLAGSIQLLVGVQEVHCVLAEKDAPVSPAGHA